MTTKNVLPDEVQIANKSVTYLEMLDTNQYPERQESLQAGIGGTGLCIRNRFCVPLPLTLMKEEKNEWSELCLSFFTGGNRAFIVNLRL
jgi:hypothetical protein